MKSRRSDSKTLAEKWLRFMKPYLDQFPQAILVGHFCEIFRDSLLEAYPQNEFFFVDPHFSQWGESKKTITHPSLIYIKNDSGVRCLAQQLEKGSLLVPVLPFRPSWSRDEKFYADAYEELTKVQHPHPPLYPESAQILGSLFL